MNRRTTQLITAAMLLLSCLVIAPEARADSVQRAEELLSSWQMEEARDIIVELAQQRPGAAEVLYLQARYAFYRGDYAEALVKIEAAIAKAAGRPDWVQLHEIIKSTLEVTRNYERHVSPDGRFEIFIEPGRDRVLLPYAFEALDKAYEALGEELGYRPPAPIRVEIYPQTSVLAKVSVLTEAEIRTSGTIALCQYNRLMITSPRALMRGYGWVDTLVHEYVHYVINRKAYNRVPIWMHEGLAKYLERRWRGPNEHALALSSERLLQERIKANTLIPFEAMHPSMAKLPSQEDAAVAFAEVYTVMEYLQKREGAGAFARLLDTINEGYEAPEAFGRVLGTSFAAFERDWRVYLNGRNIKEIPDDAGFEDRLVFKEEAGGSGELGQIAQPAARDHIHLGEMLQARQRYGAAVVQYEKAGRLIGDHNPILQTRLAQTLLQIGRARDAVNALLKVNELHPSYVTTWILLGKASNALGEHAKARDYLLEAARINPFNPEVHHELAQAYEKLGQQELAKREREFVQLVR
ncbi:MAG: tetratricopeptide repeat protein [Bradymonadaceae bacterium]|nr:tetratricopeptide repeat protein [Lujinxingiaceae bacterium]